MTNYNLLDTLERINWNHGRGNVRSYHLEEGDCFANGRGTVVRSIPTSQSTLHLETRRFRIVRGVVHFLGHQRKIEQ